MPDVSIEISARDNYSNTITSMRNSNQSFNKDLEGTQNAISDLLKKQDALSQMKKKMQTDLDEASASLKQAKKAFADNNDEINRTNLETAHENYNKISDDLKNLNSEAKDTQKSIRSLSEEQSKQENKAGTGGGLGSTENSLVSRLAGAGFTKMMGDSLSNAAQTYIGSAFGNEAGNGINSVLSGAVSGAALGTAVAPGIGTAIGAAVGTVSGAINAATEKAQTEDEYFKSTVEDRYNSAMQTQSDALDSGKTIASTREQNRISFSTLLGGNDKADDFLSQITDFAEKTPFEYDQLTTISRTLLAYGYKQDEIIPLLTKVGDTGSAFGMSADDMNYVATALGRMKSTGKTTLEYLNPLLERGVPVWDYLAKASGKTKQQVQEMVSKGLIPGSTAAQDIADAMGEANKNSMQLQSQTFSGLESTLQDANDSLNASMGKGFEDVRKQGIQDQIDWLSGDSGEKMKNAYSMIGEWQASLKNDEDKSIRDAMDAAMNSDDYKTAALTNDRKEMGRILAKAQAEGENEYMASDEYQDQLEIQKKTIEDIRSDTALNRKYWDAGYQLEQELSQGFALTFNSDMKSNVSSFASSVLGGATTDSQGRVSWNEPSVMKSMLEQGKSAFTLKGTEKAGSKSNSSGITLNLPDSGNTGESLFDKLTDSAAQQQGLQTLKQLGSGKATGLNRVPYNNYPTLLHEGEQVLTAVEARSQKSGGVQVIIQGPVTVRKESDIDEIASQLYEKLKRADAVTP